MVNGQAGAGGGVQDVHPTGGGRVLLGLADGQLLPGPPGRAGEDLVRWLRPGCAGGQDGGEAG